MVGGGVVGRAMGRGALAHEPVKVRADGVL